MTEETTLFRSGRHFLQIPGPTNLPDRVLRSMARPTIDHRGPEFARLTGTVMRGMQELIGTSGPVVLYPSSGSGAWEAALVNTLSPGDSVLAFDHGFFALAWGRVAARLGLEVEALPSDWRRPVDPETVEERLLRDPSHTIKAVALVHNETATGVTNRVGEVRKALDRAGHPALLLVDTVSSLASIDYRHDEWGVDVTMGCSQKGLMLPPGVSFNAMSERALTASREAGLARSYWDWESMLAVNTKGFFPYTPPTHHLFALEEALAMLREEGMPEVFARHRRLAEAVWCAVEGWGLELLCRDPQARSHTVTAVLMPGGRGGDELRRLILDRFDLSLGSGLGKLQDQVFRIGHLGSLNELMLAGALCGIEMGLSASGVPFRRQGLGAALESLSRSPVKGGAQ